MATSATPDLKRLEGVVSSEVLDAMRAASAALTKVGVRHVVVGGLAVGAHGYVRATKDVDFLVGDEAFEHHAGGVVTMRPGVPIQVGGVLVDFLSAGVGEEHLADALGTSGSVASAAVLIYLKLKSPRLKDRSDVVELIKAGIDVDLVREYLTKNASAFVVKLEEAIETARREE